MIMQFLYLIVMRKCTYMVFRWDMTSVLGHKQPNVMIPCWPANCHWWQYKHQNSISLGKWPVRYAHLSIIHHSMFVRKLKWHAAKSIAILSTNHSRASPRKGLKTPLMIFVEVNSQNKIYVIRSSMSAAINGKKYNCTGFRSFLQCPWSRLTQF